MQCSERPRQTSPWSTRACADYLGFTPEWVRRAIDDGVTIAGGQRVQLEAETIVICGRRRHRVHRDAFVRFLRAIGWQRLPSESAVA